MNDMGIAFELLIVGMITVFVMLSLVVLLGNLIIRFVNKFLPEVQKASEIIAESAISEINKKKMAVIVSAVNSVTKGTGRVTKIEKL